MISSTPRAFKICARRDTLESMASQASNRDQKSKRTGSSSSRIGELFILGFRGKTIPSWVSEFSERYGLGGVILFDYNCQTKEYENNIDSPEQVKGLCREISSLSSSPLICIDQEGGKVRRLKEQKGFRPLPSAKAFALLEAPEKEKILRASFSEMRKLGIHWNLAPVIDLDTNPKNPGIGAIERSFSEDPTEVRENVHLMSSVAKSVGLGLCLKHYPGLGGATVDSHLDFTDLTGTVSQEQLDLFYELGKVVFGQAVLVSHGVHREWDPDLPASISRPTLNRLRGKLPEALLLSDDLQMQGLQKIMSTFEACEQGLRAGLDMLCIGNNLMAEDEKLLEVAARLETLVSSDSELSDKVGASIQRVHARKELLSAKGN